MNIVKQIRKAEKLVASKQNRENAIALIGIDSAGNESFHGWIDSGETLYLPKNIVDIRVQAGTRA